MKTEDEGLGPSPKCMDGKEQGGLGGALQNLISEQALQEDETGIKRQTQITPGSALPCPVAIGS